MQSNRSLRRNYAFQTWGKQGTVKSKLCKVSVGPGAAVLAALSTEALADIICHHYALLAVECTSTVTLQRVSHQYSSTV